MTTQIGSTFDGFIAQERSRYDGEDDNKVAFSLGQVARYLHFLEIIHARYLEIDELCVRSFRRRIEEAKHQTGTRTMTAEEWQKHLQEAEQYERLHLEIESFFMFAKIALDKIAHAIEDHFGPARGLSLRSHDKWCKAANDFSRTRGLSLPEEMLVTAKWLQMHLVDDRDKQITHQRNPRTMFATYISGDDATQIGTTHLYPRESDKFTQSPDLHDVLSRLESYVTQLQELIASNRARSRYNRKAG